MKHYLFLVCLALISTNTVALEAPQGSKYDNRIQHVHYNPDEVVSIYAYTGLGSQIVFSPEEKIIDVGSGFSDGWEFTNRRNILYIKPKSVKIGEGEEEQVIPPTAPAWDTNVLLATNKRLYAFDLFLIKEKKRSALSNNNKVSYRIKFLYPETTNDDDVEEAKETALIESRLELKTPPRNWNYTKQVGDGSESIAPTMAYDDGTFTYLKFPNNSNFPAAFLVGKNNEESLINSHIEASIPETPNTPEGPKDILVIHLVTEAFVLRYGQEVVGIYNEDFDPEGIAPVQGSTVPGVKRTLKPNGGDKK